MPRINGRPFSVTMQFDALTVFSLLSSAIDSGGSNYWAGEFAPLYGDDYSTESMFNHGFECVDFTNKRKKHLKVTPARIRAAMKLFAKGHKSFHPSNFAAVIAGDNDMFTGDVFLQLCCFGKVIYG
jgi:hypothetical protein